MSTPSPSSGDRDLGWLYWALAAVVVILVVVGLITYSGQKDDEQAQAKAQEVTQKLQRAGLPVPDQDILVRSFGDDGGNVCDNPGDALGKAVLYDTLSNGASFAGHRPVIVDRRVVAGQALIMETYCPEKLQEFKDDILDKLKFDDVLES